MSDREVILKVENLKQHFKVGSGKNKLLIKAVDGVSFEIYKGEVFSLVGESGCGKTTTGRTLIRLYNATEGEVYFHGTRIISDVIKAKNEHKQIVGSATEAKRIAIDELENDLASAKINQENYVNKLSLIKKEFDEVVNKSLDVVKKAKKERKFEKIIDEEGIKAIDNIKDVNGYKELEIKYDAQKTELKKKLDELVQKIEQNTDEKDASVLKKEQNRLVKEAKLIDKRFSQDVYNLKYKLTHKNRLLMRRMQMIFQDPIASLNPRMTVKEIIAEGLRINGFKNEADIDVRVKEALKVVGLVPEHASRYPHEFSGGQRQRIGIARSLVIEPSFIIADEPISALDVSIRAQVINLLNDLREKNGITILFIAHDLSVVKYFSDRLAVMYYGHIVEMGEKDLIFDNPMHPYTLSLLSSIPLPDPQYEKGRTKTIRYNANEAHDYSVEKPSLREIEPGHFVLCNTAEFESYKEKMHSKWKSIEFS